MTTTRGGGALFLISAVMRTLLSGHVVVVVVVVVVGWIWIKSGPILCDHVWSIIIHPFMVVFIIMIQHTVNLCFQTFIFSSQNTLEQRFNIH